jgi:hypothetical protein
MTMQYEQYSRSQMGKTPISHIIGRYLIIMGVPFWSFVFLFGFAWVPQIGELRPSYHEGWIETTWAYRLWCICLSIFGYHFGLGLAMLWCWACNKGASRIAYQGDSEIAQWQASGGDTFFDTLGKPFNPDSDDVNRTYVRQSLQ